jgi:hypothetical protein
MIKGTYAQIKLRERHGRGRQQLIRFGGGMAGVGN